MGGFVGRVTDGKGADDRYYTRYHSVMNAAAKILEAMQANPRDWRLEQLQTVARQHGIAWRHEGTSHCYFKRADGLTLSVPAHRPIKPVYVRQFINLVKGV